MTAPPYRVTVYADGVTGQQLAGDLVATLEEVAWSVKRHLQAKGDVRITVAKAYYPPECGVTSDADEWVEAEERPGPMPDDLTPNQVFGVGGRCPRGGEHQLEPEWRGRGFDHLRCRWCGKREPV